MKVESLVSRDIFYLTMMYAFNGVHDKVPLWGHLRRIAGTITGPHAIAGDFNCVLSATERVGGNVPTTEIEPFRDCVADCRVLNINVIGSLFAWNNKQKPEERIYSRLDRVLVNKAWCDHLPNLYAHFLPEGMYDHTPCIVSRSKQTQGKCSFKYFNMWGGSKDFIPIVRSNWEKYNDNENATNIKQKQVEELQAQLGRDPTDMLLRSIEYEAVHLLKELSIARDSFFSQKAKHRWVKEGDSNSAFFHGLLKQRKHWNKVIKVEDIHGKVCDTPEQIQSAFLGYYRQLLGTTHTTNKVHKRIIDQGPRCSPNDCSRVLIRPVNAIIL
ncbi:uncharacterized protein LOC141588718 [Silene latifolia]|uniref:uncharacterized protein LOC141588718 n=1 Tax=Silene latifolia TaxID=37657 RepID=UPI003D787ACC